MQSRVLRVPSHRAFNIQSAAKFEREVPLEGAIEITPEYLSMPLELPLSSVPREDLKGAYHNCLAALLDLSPFNVIVSLRATFGDERPASRDWCQIYSEGRTVASFTHGADGLRSPFVLLTDWSVGCNDVEAWSVRRWRGFFFSQITQRACALRTDARERLASAQTDLDFGGEVTKKLMLAT